MNLYLSSICTSCVKCILQYSIKISQFRSLNYIKILILNEFCSNVENCVLLNVPQCHEIFIPNLNKICIAKTPMHTGLLKIYTKLTRHNAVCWSSCPGFESRPGAGLRGRSEGRQIAQLILYTKSKKTLDLSGL